MLIIRGVNVYPTQVETVVLRVPELTPNYRHRRQPQRHARRGGGGGGGGEAFAGDEAELRSRVERLLRETIGVGMRAVHLRRRAKAPAPRAASCRA